MSITKQMTSIKLQSPLLPPTQKIPGPPNAFILFGNGGVRSWLTSFHPKIIKALVSGKLQYKM
jgi:hypothetical protein